ncbi:MAG: hypothetical protein GEU93_06100 [Propionibacteriales bacterium]|nr:hypothetical protein [Propionibacteriales bacterium]
MSRHAERRRHGTRQRRFALASAGLVIAGAFALLFSMLWESVEAHRVAGVPGSAVATGHPGTAGPGREPVRWREVLARLDRARAEAFAASDPAALAAVYTPGSRALATDARLLARYRRQGARVAGLTMQLADVRVVRRDSGSVLLRVTDRIVGGELVDGAGGRHPLAADRPTTHRITLVAIEGGWRISDVRRV